MLNYLNKSIMEKYEDFFGAVIGLVLEIVVDVTFVKKEDAFSVFVYSKRGLALNNTTFFKTNSLDELRAKFAGLKAVCDSLKSEAKDDNPKAA